MWTLPHAMSTGARISLAREDDWWVATDHHDADSRTVPVPLHDE